jgi:L-iditol 2-dehydrogenase
MILFAYQTAQEKVRTMKALVYEGPWQMPLRQIETPEPGKDDVVVAVRAVGVCGSDVHGFMGTTGRRKPPIVMGHEFCGVITAVGTQVEQHHVGDRVVVQPLLTCGGCENCRAGRPNICMNRGGLGMNMNGAYAEAVRWPSRWP